MNMYDNNYPEYDYSGGNYSGGSNSSSGDGTYRYTGNPYPDNPDENRSGNYYSHIPPEPPKKERKKGGYLKKALASATLGIFFGLCAGLGFYAVDVSTGMTGDKEALAKEANEAIEEAKGIIGGESDTIENILEENAETAAANMENGTIVTDVTKVAANVMPAVVSITNDFTQKTTDFFGQTYESQASSSGSGIIVGKSDSELLLVSNYHVVGGADTLSVQFIDGETVEAYMKGSDSSMDLAVIAVPLDNIEDSTLSNISIASLGDSDSLQVGEPAIAIGNALGYGQSVTTGVVSAVNRTIDMGDEVSGTFIQTDAAINPGNSGGALLNVQGQVIGINSNKIGGSAIEGMGYAIPISSAKPIIEDLMLKETRTKVAEGEKGYIGISGVNVTSEVSQMYNMPEGVFVAQVYEGTGAEAAGMVKGDIITKFDGSTVGSMEELQQLLNYYAVGDTVDVTVMQGSPSGYQEKTVILTLGERFTETQQENQ